MYNPLQQTQKNSQAIPSISNFFCMKNTERHYEDERFVLNFIEVIYHNLY